MAEIKQYFMRRDNAPAVDLNRFVMSKKKSAELIKARINSKSKSPVRVRINQSSKQSRARSASKQAQATGQCARASPSPSARVQDRDQIRQSRTSLNQSLSENELGQYGDDSDDQCNEENNELYHFQKEQRHNHLNKAFMANWSSMPNNDLKFFRDAKLQDSIIYYSSSANNLQGNMYSIRDYNFKSNLYSRIYYHFIQSCLKMQPLFENSLLNVSHIFTEKSHHWPSYRFTWPFQGPRSKESCGLTHVIEQGILFQIVVDNQRADTAKSVAKDVKELCFWVVGRRKLHRPTLKSDKWQSQGDFFICFHDHLDQALVEIAFDVGFSKLGL